MFQRSLRVAASMALLFALVGCGAAQTTPETSVGNPASACLEGDENCFETGAESPADEFDADAARQDAHGVLGMYESDLAADVRIARRGDEVLALTEDHIPGRLTVELDDTDGDGMRVTLVTVELPNGQETFELTPG